MNFFSGFLEGAKRLKLLITKGRFGQGEPFFGGETTPVSKVCFFICVILYEKGVKVPNLPDLDLKGACREFSG